MASSVGRHLKAERLRRRDEAGRNSGRAVD
jgi:hypothetical protein